MVNCISIDRLRSQSAKTLDERMKEAIPESLKAQVLVKSRVEDPEVREVRKQLIESKSVSELSQISSLADFPIPTTIERMLSKSGDLSQSVSTGPPSFDL